MFWGGKGGISLPALALHTSAAQGWGAMLDIAVIMRHYDLWHYGV